MRIVRGSATALAVWGLALLWAPSARADRPESDLPRHLALAEPRHPPTVDAPIDVNLPTLETEPSSLAAALHPVAERIYALPNPYQDFDAAPLPELRPEGSTLPLPELERERRYFEMEDSGDMMGIRLNQNILAGLQVEFMGPAEDPRSSRKIVFMKTDPFHQRYLLTTAGATLRF